MTAGSMEPTGAFCRDEYDRMRKQVSELKLKQRETEKKDSLLLQQARLETEQRVREYEARIDGMQRHIRDVTDRSSKMRAQFEKEKSTLTKKCDRMALKLEDQEKSHQAEMQEVLRGFDDDKQQLQDLLGRTQELQSHTEAQHQAAMREQENKLMEDLDMRLEVLHEQHRLGLEAAQEGEASWRRKYDEMRRAKEDVEDELAAQQEEHQQMDAQVSKLQNALMATQREWEAERSALIRNKEEAQMQLADMQETWKDRIMHFQMESEDKLQEYRKNKASEMDQVHSRMKTVLAKRDSTIRQLRGELQDAQLKLSKLQGVMQTRSRELVDSTWHSPSPGRR